ncbi:MAG: CoA transferase [Proteobacteria bacterium]|nr:CoA transferase [Pseudomonadota bacterium]
MTEDATEFNTGRPGPLKGVKVIELGQLLAGPFAASRMADFGAEVIKVETPGSGDPMRNWGHYRFEGHPLWWPILARNKKSVTANLREERGRDLVRQLVKDADVLIENFKPGRLEEWGLGPEDLHAINPRLVIGRVSGYGQTGPYAEKPGFASVGEGFSGLRHINGFPGGPPPRNGISLGDTLTGIFAVQGIMMALYWRDALGGGKGQVVDAAIYESCFALLEGTLPEYDKLGIVREASGTGLANVAPSHIYPTKDGGWFIIAANVDPMFIRLCKAMGQPELAEDPKFSAHIPRGENCEELDAIIGEWTKTLSAEEIQETLEANGVVCGPINTIADIAEDPQFKARGMIRRMESADVGDVAIPGIAPVLSETPSDINWLGPSQPGEHNAEIYGGMLGYSDDELKQLAEDGII